MSTARDFRLPKMNTSQALGAGIAAGALALYVLTKRRSFYRAPSDDTPRVGSENDEIEIYGGLCLQNLNRLSNSREGYDKQFSRLLLFSTPVVTFVQWSNFGVPYGETSVE